MTLKLPASIEDRVPLFCWIIVLVTCLLIAIKILSYGYVPVGDARRYVAKAVTDKEYPQIVISGPAYHMDFSPGWEWLLRRLDRATGWNEDTLMAVSIAGSLLLILCGPLPWLRYPEAWMAALLAVNIPFPGLLSRFTQNRPFIISEAVLLCVLVSWARHRDANPSWPKMLGTCAAFALATWIHGTWYFYGLVLAAFFLAGWWRETIQLTACWLAGTLLGAALTGHPLAFLQQNLAWGQRLAAEAVPVSSLVGELQPSAGEFEALLVLGFVWLWRKQQRKDYPDLFHSPLFWMMAVCWILGLRAGRFWADWGLPAAMVWLAVQFEDAMRDWWPLAAGRRLAACALLAVPLFFDSTSDLNGRYTSSLREVFADASAPGMEGWMPGPGGTFYSADFSFFFNTFYKNPNGDWRYMLGYEPAIMPEEDLKIFRNIQYNRYAWDAYAPWAAKMRPQDRLEITSSVQPNVPPLEWHNAGGDIWIGRLPAR